MKLKKKITFWSVNATYFADNLTVLLSLSVLLFASLLVLLNFTKPVSTVSWTTFHSYPKHCCFLQLSLLYLFTWTFSFFWLLSLDLLFPAPPGSAGCPHLSVMNGLHYLSLAYESTSDKYCTINCCICVWKLKRALTFSVVYE